MRRIVAKVRAHLIFNVCRVSQACRICFRCVGVYTNIPHHTCSNPPPPPHYEGSDQGEEAPATKQVCRRVTALRREQLKQDEIRLQYKAERMALEKKYEEQYQGTHGRSTARTVG